MIDWNRVFDSADQVDSTYPSSRTVKEQLKLMFATSRCLANPPFANGRRTLEHCELALVSSKRGRRKAGSTEGNRSHGIIEYRWRGDSRFYFVLLVSLREPLSPFEVEEPREKDELDHRSADDKL